MTAAAPDPAPRSPSVVRLAGPEDVIAAVPSILGFHPTESLVLCCLKGPRKQHILTMRADLPAADDVAKVAADLAGKARSTGADRVLLLIYTETGGGPVRRDVLLSVQDALAAHDVALEDAIRVGRGRWWAYLCEQESCCPAAGTPLPDRPGSAALQLQAEMVASGLRVHADREELRASVAPVTFLARAGLEQAYDQVTRLHAARLLAGEERALRQETIGLCHQVRERYAAGRGELTDLEAARICLGMLDVGARDEVLGWAGLPDDVPLLAMLRELARRAFTPAEAPICAVLAHVAYQSGDGALAACALDRALDSDPTYQLALLLEYALMNAIHPSVLAPAFAPPERRTRRASRPTRRRPAKPAGGTDTR